MDFAVVQLCVHCLFQHKVPLRRVWLCLVHLPTTLQSGIWTHRLLPPQPTSFFQSEQCQLCQPPLAWQMLQVPHDLCGPSRESFQNVQVSLVLMRPDLDMAPRHDSPALTRGERSLPSTCLVMLCLIHPRTPVACFDVKGNLLTRGWIDVHQEPKAFSCPLALQPVCTQPVLLHEVIPNQRQDFSVSFQTPSDFLRLGKLVTLPLFLLGDRSLSLQS